MSAMGLIDIFLIFVTMLPLPQSEQGFISKHSEILFTNVVIDPIYLYFLKIGVSYRPEVTGQIAATQSV